MSQALCYGYIAFVEIEGLRRAHHEQADNVALVTNRGGQD
jgi:hypothetical protein